MSSAQSSSTASPKEDDGTLLADNQSRVKDARRGAPLLWALLILLLAVMAAWLLIRQLISSPKLVARSSILEIPINEPEFAPTATVDQLLSLAEREARQLLDRYPRSPAAHSVKARRDYLLSNTKGAEASWKEAVRLDPHFVEAMYGLGLLAFEDNRYADAAALSEDIMRLKPGDPRVVLLLANSLLHNGQAREAILTLEQHILKEKSSVQAWELLGSAHLQEQDFAKAVSCFERALSYAPRSKDSLYGLGQAYARLGEPSKAREFSQRFADLARSSSQTTAGHAQAFQDSKYAAHVAAMVYFDSTRVAKEAGDLARAEELLLRALRLEPDIVDWLKELQSILKARGRKAEAIDVGRRLVALDPGDVDQWLTLGGLHADLEMPEQAVDAFRKAIELAPDDERCRQANSIIKRLQ